MTLRAVGTTLGLLAFLATPCLAQVGGVVSPPEISASTGGPFTIAIDVDLGTSGERLGSYGAALHWDPLVLQYVSDSGGGQAPFDSALVNDLNVSLGVLSFGDADPIGADGRIRVLEVTFLALGEPCGATPIHLEFTSMFAAGTFVDLLPILLIGDGTVYITDFFLGLRARDAIATVFDWNTIPAGLSYDVIRGDIGQIFDDGVSINLGTVICWEDDSLDTTTDAGAEPANPDFSDPELGEAFFYLVRFYDGVANRTYGFTRACARERIVGAGDCP